MEETHIDNGFLMCECVKDKRFKEIWNEFYIMMKLIGDIRCENEEANLNKCILSATYSINYHNKRNSIVFYIDNDSGEYASIRYFDSKCKEYFYNSYSEAELIEDVKKVIERVYKNE